MSLTGASDGLYGALVGGGVTMILTWVQTRINRKGLGEAWQRQAGELYKELSEQHEKEVAYLRGQIAAKDESLEKVRERLTGADRTTKRSLDDSG